MDWWCIVGRRNNWIYSGWVSSLLLKNLNQNTFDTSNQIVKIVAPVGIQILKHFSEKYAYYQSITSIVFLITAVGLFAAAFFKQLMKELPLVLPEAVVLVLLSA